jgi:methionyl-tRNA formyltransferase
VSPWRWLNISTGMGKTIYYLGAKDLGTRCLKILHQFCEAEGHTIIGIFTNPRGQAIRDYAGKHNLQLHRALEELSGLPSADYLISVQYHLILRDNHICKGEQLAINLHMAPLPEYRGCNQFSFAIVNGDLEFGTTIHQIDTGVDSGGIIFESRFPIPEGCFVDDLYELTFNHSITMFSAALPKLFSGDYLVIPQSKFKGKRVIGFHYRKEIDDLKQINLDWSAERIMRYIRATSMPGFLPPYAKIGDKRIEFMVKDDK